MVISGTGERAWPGTLSPASAGGPQAAIGDGFGLGDLIPTQFVTSAAQAYDYVAPADPPAAVANIEVAALVGDTKWNSVDPGTGKTIVTYSFADPRTSVYGYSSGIAQYTATMSAFSEADKAVTRDVLARIEAVCNVQFVEVPDNGTECGVVRYAYSQQPNAMALAGYTFFPSADPAGGDIWIGAAQAQPQWDFFRPDLIVHETLHALGLKHPFGAGAVLPTQENIIPDTVMSYSPVAGGSSGALSVYPAEPMLIDIAALQYMYGAAPTAVGDTRYDLASPEFQNGFNAIWDAGGTDVLDASGIGHGVILNLDPGAHSNIGVSVTASANVNGVIQAATYTDTLSIALGAQIENAIGTASDDVLIGNAGPNLLQGGGGNDTLRGGGGNDGLDGGPGIDIAVFSGARSDYAITPSAGSVLVADSAGGRDGVATLIDVERAHFSDGWLAFDSAGDAGKAYRLYQAAFDRAPDDPGLGYWISNLDQGLKLADAARSFIASPEFSSTYGSLTNVQFVTQLYANVLHRAPDAAGLAYHVAHLDSGALARADVLVSFSESPENQAALIGTIEHGMPYSL